MEGRDGIVPLQEGVGKKDPPEGFQLLKAMNPRDPERLVVPRWLPGTLEIGLQGLLVLALAVWLLQGRPWGYAPEWTLRVHAPWPLLRLWWLLVLTVVLGGWAGWWAKGLEQREPPAGPKDDLPERRLPTDPAGRRRAIAVLLLLWLLAVSWQGGLHVLADLAVPLLVSSTWSSVGTEYFRTAYEIQDIRAFLRDYPRFMAQAQYHVATHPPGAVLFYWLGLQVIERTPGLRGLFLYLAEYWSGGSAAEIARFSQQFPSAANLPPAAVPAALFSAFLLMLCGSSVVIPIYLLARLEGSRRSALLAAACFCTVPSFLLFFQSLDQLVLLLATWTVYLFLQGVQRERGGFFPAAGALWGLTLFVSLGALPLGILGGVILVGRAWQRRQQVAWLKWIAWFAAFLGGALGIWWWLALLADFPPLQVIRQGLAAHARVTTVEFPRTYSIWVWLNGVDFAVFLGLPLSVWWVRSLWQAGLQSWRPREGPPSSSPTLLGWLNLAFLFTLLALDLSGKVRAEVGRIWLFLMPLAVVGLVHRFCQDFPESSEGRRLWWLRLGATLGLQLLQVSLMALTMTPLVLPF